MPATRPHAKSTMVTASAWETVQFLIQVLVPTVAMGAVKRRRFAVRIGEALRVDRRAINWLQRARRKHGANALYVRLPMRTVIVPLEPDDVGEILQRVSAFTPDTQEKHAALAKFQPHGVLITRSRPRSRLRAFNEGALQFDEPLHEAAHSFVNSTYLESRQLTQRALGEAKLDYAAFEDAWWKIVRTVVFGEHARTDSHVVDILDRLRQSANWSYLTPGNSARRHHLGRLLRASIADADPGSLTGHVNVTDPYEPDAWHQVAHWLFAFDAAAMATYRALALLATHPGHGQIATREATAHTPTRPEVLPYLRACVEESLRLWPTTPFLLRDGTQPMRSSGIDIPAGAAYLIFTPLFHRDNARLEYADRFAPEAWFDGRARNEPGIVPFSAGPARCPGQNVVLLVASTALATMLGSAEFRLASTPKLDPSLPLPASFDPFHSRFAVTPKKDSGAETVAVGASTQLR